MPYKRISEYDTILQWIQENHPHFNHITSTWIRPFLIKAYKPPQTKEKEKDWIDLQHICIWYRTRTDVHKGTQDDEKIYICLSQGQHDLLPPQESITLNPADPNIFQKITNHIKLIDQKMTNTNQTTITKKLQ